MNKKKLLLSLGLVTLVVAAVVGGTIAFFSDTEKSENNSFVAGSVDLKIDSECHYFQNDIDVGCRDFGTWRSTDLTQERFFAFGDVKPGDWGENTLSLTVDDNDAYVCMYIENAVNAENDLIDPEIEADDTTADVGELAANLHFTAWVDQGLTPGWQGKCLVSDATLAAVICDEGEGDNRWQGPEKEPLLFSNVSGPATDVLDGKVYDLGVMMGMETNYVGVLWCAGDLVVDGDAMRCSGATMGNESQTDSLTADVRFYAEQTRNNANFVCPGLEPTPITRHISLENKNSSWQILSDDQIYGDIGYSHNDTTFHGVVTGTGLVAGGKYQITLNGPGGCTFTDNGFAGIGPNAFSSGYWNNGVNLEPTCSTPGEGVYNMSLVGDHYTFIADGSGAFNYPFTLNLPAGDYSGVKVLVKKMLDTHVSPWADTGGSYPAFNLYETAPISFTVL